MFTFVFPVINSKIETKAFDLQTFGYSVSTAKKIIDNLDPKTTDLYLFPQLSFLDLLYPFLCALFLSSLLFRLMNLPEEKGKVIPLLLITPFLAMIFDYSENICITLMITKTINISKIIVYLSSTFTILKGVLTSIAWVAILIYSVKWMINRKRRNSNT
jgi:formate hydrogenlyase subunit 3/multisubunit Na+/H+ antiporter MnhD subunit